MSEVLVGQGEGFVKMVQVTTRIARLTAAGLMLWPAAGMGAVSVASLFSGRPQSRLAHTVTDDPPELLMGLLISLGLISAVTLIAAVALAGWGLFDGRGWGLTRGMLATGYVTGSAAGFICFFMVGKGSTASDRGLELAGRYQVAAGLLLLLLAAVPLLSRLPVGSVRLPKLPRPATLAAAAVGRPATPGRVIDRPVLAAPALMERPALTAPALMERPALAGPARVMDRAALAAPSSLMDRYTESPRL